MDFENFLDRLTLFVGKNPELIIMTLSNIFTMRLIGNKTHGDLAEVAISEFVNQYMYDYKSQHVGKDLFRAKNHEEDILITEELTGSEIPVSLKAYGDGPLQLSTDKNAAMFPLLQSYGEAITERETIREILQQPCFTEFTSINVLPLIYDEKKKRCNIMVFDNGRAFESTAAIRYINSGSGRKHPVYRFENDKGEYICEVRYGGPSANALQRGLWTHTVKALPYFRSVSGGWIDYSHNMTLIELFSHALVSSEAGHACALVEIDKDISRLKAGK